MAVTQVAEARVRAEAVRAELEVVQSGQDAEKEACERLRAELVVRLKEGRAVTGLCITSEMLKWWSAGRLARTVSGWRWCMAEATAMEQVVHEHNRAVCAALY